MDPRTYIYELRRPRLNNPTYNSNCVNNSCFSIYAGGPLDTTKPQNLPSHETQPIQSQATMHMKDSFVRSRGSSQLSNIGSSLLRLEDRDIYNKQKSKFDIISMKPAENCETIKKYPKLTLEDKDAYYYRRVAKAQLLPTSSNEMNSSVTQNNNDNAGKHTYDLDRNKQALDMWQSYQGKNKSDNQRFRYNMLKHADQFRSLM